MHKCVCFVCMCVHMQECVYASLCVHEHVYMCLRTRVRMCVCVCMCPLKVNLGCLSLGVTHLVF